MSESTDVIRLWEDGEKNKTEISRITGVPRTTVRRILSEYNDDDDNAVSADSIVNILGFTPDDVIDGKTIVEKMVEAQDVIVDRIVRRYSQSIEIKDDKPVGVALFSDLRLGNKYVDYKAIRDETTLVANTDGFYCMALGDYHDNWIGKLEGIQREMPVDFASEIAMLEWWVDLIRDKLIVVVGGNHDTGRTKRISGIDYVKRILKGVRTLYDPDEVRFTFKLGEGEWRFKCRHAWMGTSVYNDTHGIEKDPRFGDDEFDVGIGGHTHRGTIFREFMFHHKKRLAILLGTYKYHDGYATRLGFPRSPNTASGGLLMYPDGRMVHYDDLFALADYLKYLRR
jgi:hypothetical protein